SWKTSCPYFSIIGRAVRATLRVFRKIIPYPPGERNQIPRRGAGKFAMQFSIDIMGVLYYNIEKIEAPPCSDRCASHYQKGWMIDEYSLAPPQSDRRFALHFAASARRFAGGSARNRRPDPLHSDGHHG